MRKGVNSEGKEKVPGSEANISEEQEQICKPA